MLTKLIILGCTVLFLTACSDEPKKPAKEAWEVCIEMGKEWKDKQCVGVTVLPEYR